MIVSPFESRAEHSMSCSCDEMLFVGTDEIRDAGFDLIKEIPLLKDQYYLVFKER
jgi:hypothetical protein